METTEQRAVREGGAPSLRFEDLGLGGIALAAVRDLGYEEPTPVQAQAIPQVLAGRDILAAAQTGTGKTAAFLLPVMDRLEHVPPVSVRGRLEGQGPFLLVITPTRELAQQIEDVCRVIARRTHHTSVTVVGGVGYNPQKDALKRGCDILIATPGRLLDLIGQEACSLDQVKVLVLDEADRMLDMGFAPDVRKIVGCTPKERQTLLFSATLEEKAVGAITDLVHDPVRIEIAPVTRPTETVAQYVLPVSTETKNGLLSEVLRHQGARRVIVFCRTKRRADTCAKRLARAGFTCGVIHGDRSQAQRERALEEFREGKVEVLVATDVLSRGIDISDVSYVVNFDVPEDPVDYIHRIGRTGRAGELGWSLTFVTPDDVAEFYDIEALMGRTVEVFDTCGLEVGEGAPYLDPKRVPAGHVPSKKEKKRRRARARDGAAGAKNSAKAKAARASGSGSGSDKGSDKGSNKGSNKGSGAGDAGHKQRGGRADTGGAKQRGGRADGAGHKQRGGRTGGRSSGSSSDRAGSRGSGRGGRDAWRNYDEPSNRHGRTGSSSSSAASKSRSSSKGTRRPGDGGGR